MSCLVLNFQLFGSLARLTKVVVIMFFYRIMMADPDLYQLYKDLVVGNVISSEEFWANRSVVCKFKHE